MGETFSGRKEKTIVFEAKETSGNFSRKKRHFTVPVRKESWGYARENGNGWRRLIIVLGCQVKDDGSLSHMLRDRLMRGLEVYEAGAAPKLLMSGDHGREDYDEVGAMKNYAIENGVPSEDIFMDHAGFSTYETVYRAKEIFEADKVIIVTQEYHLYRALYIAKQLGVEAYGVSSDLNTYAGQSMRDFREVLARCKDWAMCIFKPEPKYLGEAIPVSGNGDLTNDI